MSHNGAVVYWLKDSWDSANKCMRSQKGKEGSLVSLWRMSKHLHALHSNPYFQYWNYMSWNILRGQDSSFIYILSFCCFNFTINLWLCCINGHFFLLTVMTWSINVLILSLTIIKQYQYVIAFLTWCGWAFSIAISWSHTDDSFNIEPRMLYLSYETMLVCDDFSVCAVMTWWLTLNII